MLDRDFARFESHLIDNVLFCCDNEPQRLIVRRGITATVIIRKEILCCRSEFFALGFGLDVFKERTGSFECLSEFSLHEVGSRSLIHLRPI